MSTAATSNSTATTITTATGVGMTGGKSSSSSSSKCICNWKRCRNYQNLFVQDANSNNDESCIFAGPPIKLKLEANIPEHVALKEAIDRTLQVSNSNNTASDKNAGSSSSSTASSTNPGGGGVADWKTNPTTGISYVRYTIARHHYTERHLQKFLDAQAASNSNSNNNDAANGAGGPDFTLATTFTKHGAKKYLAQVDPQDTIKNEASGDLLYLPVPNVPKEKIDAVCSALKKKLRNSNNSNNNNAAAVARSRQTEQENVVLRDQIDNMKSQLAYLQDMVMKLQEEHYVGANSSVAGSTRSRSNHYRSSINPNMNNNNSNISSHNAGRGNTRRTYSARSQSIRSGRSGVPHEIELGDSDDETDINTHWNENNTIVDDEDDHPGARGANNNSNSNHNSMMQQQQLQQQLPPQPPQHHHHHQLHPHDIPENDDWTEYGDDVDPSDTSGTYQGSTINASHHHHHSSNNNSYRTPRRRNSCSGMSVGSCVSTKSRAKSVISTAKSVKSLPREIELDEDEEDSDDHESLEEEAFDNRSIASSKISHGGVSLDDYGHRNRSRRSVAGGSSTHRRQGDNSVSGRGVSRRGSNGTSVSGSRHSYTRNSRRGSVRSGAAPSGSHHHRTSGGGWSLVDDNASVASTRSGKSVTFDASSQNGSGQGSSHGAGTYQVASLEVTDPYGEKGTYTGSISHSTGMPHGSGRLEYDKAGRWYEGDWKHGRWTGYGRLSNGDGDFYEGGLKNDHKHGRGVMRFADGRTFVGEYVNGQMIEGKMTYQDGSTYAGSWVDGMRHGRGRCVFSDQSVYEGEFREGEFYGYGRMAWSDGGWYEGEWFNGEMHGRGKEVRPDGTLRHDGEWSKGQPIRH